jgi:hypothetical protein
MDCVVEPVHTGVMARRSSGQQLIIIIIKLPDQAIASTPSAPQVSN